MNTSYLNEPLGRSEAPIETAKRYLSQAQQYKECVERGLFSLEDLAIFFALQKAHHELIASPINVDRTEDESYKFLSDKLGIEVPEIMERIGKINDGLNANRRERNKNSNPSAQ